MAVERHVREIVGRRFPGHGFVGEEFGGSAEAGTPCWYLDPVDGTTNLANAIPWNSFSLCLAVDRVPLVGIVADPWRDELFEAVRGGGARLDGVALSIRTSPAIRTPSLASDDSLAGRVVGTELAGHRPWPGMIEFLDQLADRYCTLRIMGSGTLTLVGVAAGRGAGAVIGRFSPADHLAAALIVHEAGGAVWNADGRPDLFPASGGILAAAPACAQVIHQLWQSARHAAGDDASGVGAR